MERKPEYFGKKVRIAPIYEQFNNIDNCDIFELDNFEKNNMVPIVINYRTLKDNKIFCIKYKIKHFCSGTWKFSNQPIENLISKPFIIVPYIFYTDENNFRNVKDFFKNYIYININAICNENDCFNENGNIVNFYVKK